MRDSSPQCRERVARNASEAASRETAVMENQLVACSQNLCEQREQLAEARRRVKEDIGGNVECGQCARCRMQQVSGRCEPLEQRAEIQGATERDQRERELARSELRAQQERARQRQQAAAEAEARLHE